MERFRDFLDQKCEQMKALKKGDTIGIVAPAKPADEKVLAFCVQQLQQRGFNIKLADNLTQRHLMFAGDEPLRAKSFMECWCDAEVAAVWCIRGGYGCTPLLDHLDFSLLIQNPKIFIGMSDATALHCALAPHFVTFLGPTLGYLFADPKNTPFTEQALWDVVMEAGPPLSFSTFEVLRPGLGEGKLTGGNLALITALIGTPWQLETKGKILVLEDVNEAPYRIDRMLCQMKQSGLLEGLAGVILCSFADCEGDDAHLALPDVLRRYFTRVDYPVVCGFPNGHIGRQYTLPLGAHAVLDAEGGSLKIEREYLKSGVLGNCCAHRS